MTDTRKADALDWGWIEKETTYDIPATAHHRALIELRARVEALEAQQQPQDKLDRLIAQDRAASDAPRPNGLVERVEDAIHEWWVPSATTWNSEARAAILAVAGWLRQRGIALTAQLLENEVDLG